jgi:hypothetical protein
MRLLAALLFSLCALHAQASFMNGNQLLEWFESDVSVSKGGEGVNNYHFSPSRLPDGKVDAERPVLRG